MVNNPLPPSHFDATKIARRREVLLQHGYASVQPRTIDHYFKQRLKLWDLNVVILLFKKNGLTHCWVCINHTQKKMNWKENWISAVTLLLDHAYRISSTRIFGRFLNETTGPESTPLEHIYSQTRNPFLQGLKNCKMHKNVRSSQIINAESGDLLS